MQIESVIPVILLFQCHISGEVDISNQALLFPAQLLVRLSDTDNYIGYKCRSSQYGPILPNQTKPKYKTKYDMTLSM